MKEFSLLELALLGWALLAAAMAVGWAICRRRDKASPVDVLWAFGVGAAALLFAALAGGGRAAAWFAAGVALLWSLRLGTYLARRVSREREDGRYVALKRAWGERAWPRLFWFFQAQGLLALLLAVPALLLIADEGAALGPRHAAAAALALLAVAGEWVSDAQLERFRARPDSAGGVCKRGLWRYSRHPNYFFEWLHWLAYPVMGWGEPYWPATWIGAVLMLWLILKVTGIPPAEAQSLKSRGEAYRQYQRETSAFFPWLPKARPER